jgi:hypothetical protein
LLDISTLHDVAVDIVEGPEAAIKEHSIHQVHECKEAIFPKLGNELTLKKAIIFIYIDNFYIDIRNLYI